MSKPGPVVLARMQAAAELRAAGVPWSRVEEKLGCRPNTCRSFSSRYPVEWAQIYTAALAERDDDSEAESIRTLRELLRNTDKKTQREAARDLLSLLRRRDQRKRAAAASPDSLENLSNENLEALLLALEPAAHGNDGAAATNPGTRSE